jgi:hypothetical protein
MQLTYRGIAFQSPVTGTDATETGEMGTFMGRSYSIKRAQLTQRHGNTLTCRGARYTR